MQRTPTRAYVPSLPAGFRALACLMVSLVPLASGAATETGISSHDRAFFENRIRPLLVKHCYQCHDGDAKELGGKLRLDHRDGLLTGGESGPAVKPGDPNASLLVHALRYEGLEMPPEAPLPPAAIAAFVEWIRRGAPDPRVSDGQNSPAALSAEDGANGRLWSLMPLKTPSPPMVQDEAWPVDPLDHFILAKLESHGIQPNSIAAPRDLIRRLYFDLIGLPPTLEEIHTFVQAYELHPQHATREAVDRLLSLPQFGERWGRHWLDVVRYGESNGNDGLGRNPTFPHAWRYRDYVIEAFNQDLPFDRFLMQQIAGDLLPAGTAAQRDLQLVATGMLAMASKPAKAMNTNFEMDVVADQLDVIGRGVLGLSVGCARCHDHKFDPISTRDYYAMAGIFTSTETMWGVAANEGLTAPKTGLHELKAAPTVLPPKDFVETVLVLESNTGKPKPIPKSPWKAGAPLAMGVRDLKTPADCRINVKGDAKKLGPAVPRGFLAAMGRIRRVAPDRSLLPPIESTNASSSSLLPIQIPPGQSGRLQLAQWLASPENPLTARVITNRVWLHLFGEGIVRTPDDFGVYGERPTHPKLLDHLAHQLINDEWSVKRLIRAIVLSRTYQLSSEVVAADPEDLLWARHPRRRLDAESLRDSMLMVSGVLDRSPGDGSIVRHRDILVNLAGNLHQPSSHRSVYLCYLRSSPPPELAAFDLPDFTTVIGQRSVTTGPAQALHLFNRPFVLEQARHVARRVVTPPSSSDVGPTDPLDLEASNDLSAKIVAIFQLVLQRSPTSLELQDARQLLADVGAQDHVDEQSLARLAQALLITNEFRYVD